MQHNRPRKKGSFDDQLDDLLKQFDDELTDDARERERSPDDKREDDDRLIGRAWRSNGAADRAPSERQT
ncbi:MAG TPA: hypothetical protein VFM42_07740 [Sphingomicrobium sp.]|jgi:hypothetical protein|nr:hypothetical protein [Sphingomicrobium sp.]